MSLAQEEIAARNAAAAEAARGEKKKCGYGALPQCDTEEEQDNGGALTLVGGVLVGSVALSVPFYCIHLGGSIPGLAACCRRSSLLAVAAPCSD